MQEGKHEMTIGERIKMFRVSSSLTQKQLGELCDPPMADSAIRRYESGKQIPKPETLDRIAKALGVSVGEIDFRYLDENTLYNSLIAVQNTITELKVRIKSGSKEENLLSFMQNIESDLENAILHKENSIENKEKQELLHFFEMLNSDGKEKAIEHLKLLTEIPKYSNPQNLENNK